MVRKRGSQGPADGTEEPPRSEDVSEAVDRVEAGEPDLESRAPASASDADWPRDPVVIETPVEPTTSGLDPAARTVETEPGSSSDPSSQDSVLESSGVGTASDTSQAGPTSDADPAEESNPWHEPEPAVVARPASAEPPRRGGVGALLLGGALAGALGFGAAWVSRGPDGAAAPAALPPEAEERLAALEARPLPEGADLEPIAARLEEAEARLAALEEAGVPAPDLAPLQQEVAAAAAQAEARAAALEERLAALEARPEAPAPASAGSLVPAEGPEAAPAPSDPTLEPRLAEAESAVREVREEVATLASRLDDIETRLAQAEEAGAAAIEEAQAAQAALEESRAQTAAAEAEARRGAALAALGAALDQGSPFEVELDALGTEPSEALARAAAGGVPTLATLREGFPEASRAALAAARDAGLADAEGVAGTIRSFLSVRSTAPREGEDPDAILSRAEAALAQGRLDEALAELAALPEPARAAMAGWTAGAEARAAALAALDALRAAPEPAAAPAD